MTTKKISHHNKLHVQEDSFLVQKESIPEIKDIKTANAELQLWAQTYKEIIEILADVVPFSKEKQKDITDKRSSLLKLCREVVKIAKEPKNSKEYQSLLKKFNECQYKLTVLIQKNDAMINDTYNFVHDDNYDIEQSDKTQITIRLSNLDNILSQEIEQNKKYLPNHTTNLAIETNEQLPLVKKQSNTFSYPQKKKGKSVFPPVSELLSSSFQKNSKNDLFQLPESTGNQNYFDINYSKIETSMSPTALSVPLKEQIQSEPSIVNKAKQIQNDEIPFGKRSVAKKTRNKVKTKKRTVH